MTVERRLGRRCVLKDSSTVENVMEYAEASDWSPIGRIPADSTGGVHFELVWDAGPDARTHYVEDEFAHVRYLTATGSDPIRLEKIMARIEHDLPVWTVESLLGKLDHAEGTRDRVVLLIRLGMAAPLTAVPTVMESLVNASTDPEPAVRRAVVWAMIYTNWREFCPVLVALADDPVADIAAAADSALRELDDYEDKA